MRAVYIPVSNRFDVPRRRSKKRSTHTPSAPISDPRGNGGVKRLMSPLTYHTPQPAPSADRLSAAWLIEEPSSYLAPYLGTSCYHARDQRDFDAQVNDDHILHISGKRVMPLLTSCCVTDTDHPIVISTLAGYHQTWGLIDEPTGPRRRSPISGHTCNCVPHTRSLIHVPTQRRILACEHLRHDTCCENQATGDLLMWANHLDPILRMPVLQRRICRFHYDLRYCCRPVHTESALSAPLDNRSRFPTSSSRDSSVTHTSDIGVMTSYCRFQFGASHGTICIPLSTLL